MKVFEAASVINAPPDRIWSILTNGASYPSWNSTVDRLEGRIAPDEQVKLFVKANPGRAFPVKVTAFHPGQLMRWSGGMPLGLFKGERTFSLLPQGATATRFNMREEYTGLLLPLIWPSIPDLGPSFQQFADDLKMRAESATG
jgi:hypothetical protein